MKTTLLILPNNTWSAQLLGGGGYKVVRFGWLGEANSLVRERYYKLLIKVLEEEAFLIGADRMRGE